GIALLIRLGGVSTLTYHIRIQNFLEKTKTKKAAKATKRKPWSQPVKAQQE
nr:hypothetical protein [Tanacetum cinerariifolium]